jgi:hypothetical protein
VEDATTTPTTTPTTTLLLLYSNNGGKYPRKRNKLCQVPSCPRTVKKDGYCGPHWMDSETPIENPVNNEDTELERWTGHGKRGRKYILLPVAAPSNQKPRRSQIPLIFTFRSYKPSNKNTEIWMCPVRTTMSCMIILSNKQESNKFPCRTAKPPASLLQNVFKSWTDLMTLNGLPPGKKIGTQLMNYCSSFKHNMVIAASILCGMALWPNGSSDVDPVTFKKCKALKMEPS